MAPIVGVESSKSKKLLIPLYRNEPTCWLNLAPRRGKCPACLENGQGGKLLKKNTFEAGTWRSVLRCVMPLTTG